LTPETTYRLVLQETDPNEEHVVGVFCTRCEDEPDGERLGQLASAARDYRDARARSELPPFEFRKYIKPY
jgi:hypothetical protein